MLALGLVHSLGPVSPIAPVGFVLQLAGIGGLVGTALALRLRLRRRSVDCWMVVAAWTTLGGVIALLVVLVAYIGG